MKNTLFGCGFAVIVALAIHGLFTTPEWPEQDNNAVMACSACGGRKHVAADLA